MTLLRALALGILLLPFPVTAGTLSPDHPDILSCPVAASDLFPAGDVFLFLSGLGEDGTAVYQSLGANSITAVYDGDGNLTGPSSKVCAGMSLPELRSSGKTHDY